MQKLSLTRLNELFEIIAADKLLYLPVDNSAGQAQYKKWVPGVTMSQALNTVRSAKDFFFPQTENIVDFKMTGKDIELIDSRSKLENFVIFGVRACDARSFSILDKVFLAKPVDTFYQSRREHGTIITLSCTRPEETCFCSVFGIDAGNPEGDISSWVEDGEIYFEANTEKGTVMMKSFESILEAADDSAVKEQKKRTKEIIAKLPLGGLDLSGFNEDELLEKFNSPKWADLSQSCLGCGTCTFICPTCQCYDICDFDTGHEVKRFRCWDSCMYSDFTKMAHGNPRITQTEKFRQRFMHKLIYFPSNNNGEYGCVGCGRCLAKCPVSMNIAKVARALGDE